LNIAYRVQLEQSVYDLGKMAFREDLPVGDVTASLLGLEQTRGEAFILCREDVCMSGCLWVPSLLQAFFDTFCGNHDQQPDLKVTPLAEDATRLVRGSSLYQLSGASNQMLAFERTFLNFLSRGIGIANQTHDLVQLVRATGSGTRVLDTRKTLPGYRFFDKYAVLCGGGMNHRMSLSDQVLIKENHIAKFSGVRAVLDRVSSGNIQGIPVEIEVQNLDECREAIQTGCDIIMLDNFTPEQVAIACELEHASIQFEASGGITAKNIELYCQAGVDRISIGSLTHSVIAPDLTMLIEEELKKTEN
jgi:nicotinate-nucleotide pyrophosphorylase (carboxylating)